MSKSLEVIMALLVWLHAQYQYMWFCEQSNLSQKVPPQRKRLKNTAVECGVDNSEHDQSDLSLTFNE